MVKKIAAGSEVDAYCTKCKLDLNHRIIAMVGDTIKRVECLTCGGHHNYRQPKSERTVVQRRPASSGSPGRRVATASKSQQVREWEGSIMGKAPDDFTPYNMKETFKVGQLIRHKKFGDGVIVEIMESDKVQVLFQSGPRTLVHGR